MIGLVKEQNPSVSTIAVQAREESVAADGVIPDAALKALDGSFDYGIALLKQETDATLQQLVASPPQFMGPSSRARMVTFLAGHTWDIYGQMVVYLRLNGLVPPASKRM